MALELVDSHGNPILPRLITHWGDGAIALTNRDISADLQVLGDLKKGADNADAVAVETSNVLKVLAQMKRFNGAAWDRVRNNVEATVLASAARTASASSADQVNYNAKGVVLFFNVSAVPGADTVRLIVRVKDPISGLYVDALAGAALDSTGLRAYTIYPGQAAGGLNSGVLAQPLPRTWMAYIEHSAASSFTYSLAASYLD